MAGSSLPPRGSICWLDWRAERFWLGILETSESKMDRISPIAICETPMFCINFTSCRHHKVSNHCTTSRSSRTFSCNQALRNCARIEARASWMTSSLDNTTHLFPNALYNISTTERKYSTGRTTPVKPETGAMEHRKKGGMSWANFGRSPCRMEILG